MILHMTDLNEANSSPANVLCQSCGLCCTGHLFIWAKLRPSELDPAEALGMMVFRSDPSQRGFSQPCPMWNGQCTIYESAHYPHVCRAYKCKLLKEVLAEKVSLDGAMVVIEQAKRMIAEVEALLPDSTNRNFRERLVEYLETLQAASPQNKDVEFQKKAETLLALYEEVFGVDDLIEDSDEL